MKNGRHSKLTAERRKVILDALLEGCTHRAAYGMARISAETFYRWLKEQPVFCEDVRAAEAWAESQWLEAAKADPKSRVKLLSLRFRDDWGERIQLEHMGGVSVTYTNDWRGAPADAPPGADGGAPAGEAVQLADRGPSMA